MSDAAVAHAMAWCRDVCRTRARNFYYGLKLSPEPQRSALYAIYAWMRVADDLVDGASHTQPTSAEIEHFRAQTVASLQGHANYPRQPHEHEPLWQALAHVAGQFDLPHDSFHDMLDGQIDDLTPSQYTTFDELRRYCQRVASSVGVLCIRVWGCTDAQARDLAIDRGIAFQLTNIIRDFKQDYDGGRVYVPQEEFVRLGVSPQEVRQWANPPQCEAFVQHQIDRARRYYDQSMELDEFIAPPFRPTLTAMTAIYRALLERMARSPACIVGRRRVRLSAFHKAAIALRAKWQTRGTVASPVTVAAPVRTHSGNSAGR